LLDQKWCSRIGMRTPVKFGLHLISLLIDDYDEAIGYYTEVLGFRLYEDTELGDGKRWVVVGPPEDEGARLLLAQAKNDVQKSAIGHQSGGRVFLFWNVRNFDAVVARLESAKVHFERPAHEAPYGRVAVFRDKYGNLWDLIQPNLDYNP